MAGIERFGPVMLSVILLIGAGCSGKGSGPQPMIVPSRGASDAASSESPSGSPAAKKAEGATAVSELFRESFQNVKGSIQWNRDGGKSAEGPPSERTIYFFNGLPEGGPLVMRIFEDSSSPGPDGEPGVLALSWQEIPQKLPYSGFTYLGGREASGRMTLPLLKQAKSSEDLRPLRLAFRYQGMNERRDMPFGLNINCRLEPLLPESYGKRLDLATLSASDQWSSFEMGLAEGTNSEAFLRAIAEENPPGFKIIWAQTGPLTSYRPGDTLLIDDIVITHAMAE